MSREKQPAFDLARVLAILGGLLVVVVGVLDIASLFTRRNVPSLESIASTVGYSVLIVALGLVAVFGSRYVKSIGWDVVLIVVGVLAYEFDGGGFLWFAPIIVILAGVVGLIAKLV